MDANVVECGGREQCGERGACACAGGGGLGVLQAVRRGYEERMALIENIGGSKKLQMQVDVLRQWVGDLVGQNALLARAVEELEAEATARLLRERRRHQERDGKKRKICGNVTEMKILNDSLQKENTAKDREIRRLNKDVQQYEQTIINLRKEMSSGKHYSSNSSVPKKDAEVMAGMCCTQGSGNEGGDLEPVRECSLALRGEGKHQDRIKKMETTLKASSDSVRALRKMNVALSEELHGTRLACVALIDQCHAAALSTQFKEDIIREMRRQLNQAKSKLKELSGEQKQSPEAEHTRSTGAYDSTTAVCVRQQPRRREASVDEDDGCSPRLEGSGDDGLSARLD